MRGRTNITGVIDAGASEPVVAGDLSNLTWTTYASSGTDNLIKVKQVNDKYIALSDTGNLYYSDDAQAWTKAEVSSGHILNDVIFANGYYYVCGGSEFNDTTTGILYRSPDLIQWTEVFKTTPRGKGLAMMCLGDNFVIVERFAWKQTSGTSSRYSGSYRIETTKDFVTYNSITLPGGYDLQSSTYSCSEMVRMVYGYNALIVMYDSYGQNYDSPTYLCMAVSTDNGATFTTKKFSDLEGAPSYSEYKQYGLDFIDGQFVMHFPRTYSNSSQWLYGTSVNGLSWTWQYGQRDTSFATGYNGKVLHINNNQVLFNTEYYYVLPDDKLIKFSSLSPSRYSYSGVKIKDVMVSDKIVAVGSNGLVLVANLQVDRNKYVSVIPREVEQILRIETGARSIHVAAVTNSIDVNIKPENIKAGVTILGITGTY